jgi:hypothetical protein
MAGIVALGALVTAVVMTLSGAASGIAELLDGRLWAGQLIVGLSVLLITALTIFFGLRSVMGSSRSAMIKKYEHWRNHQQAEFGHDIVDRAKQH